MKFITKSKTKKIESELEKMVLEIHFNFSMLAYELEREFGEDFINKKLNHDKEQEISFSLRDRIGVIMTELITRNLEITSILNLDQNNFRDKLDSILVQPKIYDGQYDSWVGNYPESKSMELERLPKKWWSRIKKL